MSNAVRHTLGIPLGIVIGPVSLGLLAYGGLNLAFPDGVSVTGADGQSVDFAASTVAGYACLGVGAVLLGLLAAARFLSPLAAFVAGLCYAVPGAALLKTVAPTLPPGQLRPAWETAGAVPWAALNAFAAQGAMLAIGIALLVTAFLPNRWRGRPKPAQDAADVTAPEVTEPATGTELTSEREPTAGREPLPRRPKPDPETETEADAEETTTSLKATAPAP